MDGKVIAEIKPTYRCNQRCYFCIWEARKKILPMKASDLVSSLRLIDESVRPDILVLSGGEPLLYRELPLALSLIGGIKSLSAIHLHTNATSVSRHAQLLSDLKGVEKTAMVGFHGHNEEVFRSVTGSKGHFQKALAGIGSLIQAGFSVRADCVICKANYRHLTEITGVLLGAGVSFLELRLPLSGPWHTPGKYYVDKTELTPHWKRWNGTFGREPRAVFTKTSARCGGKPYFESQFAVPHTYYFCDQAQSAKVRIRRSKTQLQAIWPRAFKGYSKGKQCAECVFDAGCKGFSRAEKAHGYAEYRPVRGDMFLND